MKKMRTAERLELSVNSAVRGRMALESVELSAKPTGDEEGVWNILCYEVELKATGTVIGSKELRSILENFKRYPKVPIVIEHADTSFCSDEEMASPHGWVTDLRLGTFTRPDGRVTQTLEGKLNADPETKLAINGDKEKGIPPKYPFGSVTIVSLWDEEHDVPMGPTLWSFSLTAHPRLFDVPKLTASIDAKAFETAASAKQPQKENATMNPLLILAMSLGFATASEKEAEAKLTEFVSFSQELFKALGIEVKSYRDALPKIAQLSADVSKLPALQKRVAEFEQAELARKEARRAEHIEALLSATPELASARAALESFSRHDYEAFAKAYPMPKLSDAREKASTEAAESTARAADSVRLSRLSSLTAKAPPPSGKTKEDGKALAEAATVLMARARSEGVELSYRDALASVLVGSSMASENLQASE